MDDKTISSPDTTEYKFAESDGVSETVAVDQQPAAETVSGEALAASSGFSIKGINLRKLIVPSVIVLTILFVYTVLNFYGVKKTHAAEQQKIQAQEAVTQQQTVVSEQPVKAGLSNKQIEQIEQAQTVVQQKMNEVEQNVLNNHNQFASLQDAVSKGQQDISDISQNVSQLAVATQQVLAEIKQLSTQKVKSKRKPAKTKPPIIYHIRAIVPGRVWIESADGKSITLRVGDKLNGYGTVEIISPQQGMVLMSDGSYIQYGVNDF